MFKALGRKAAQQNYATFLMGMKANPSGLPEVRVRAALKLRNLARQRGITAEIYEQSSQGLINFFRDFEVSFSKLDALEASTNSKNYAMKLRSTIGISPNYLALQAIAGYLQMIGQCSPNDFYIRGGDDTSSTKNGIEMRNFRELLVKVFEDVEQLLFTDVADKAAEKQGVTL